MSAITVRPLDVGGNVKPSSQVPALCAISGLGHFLPSHVITNADIAETVDTSDEWIVERTGIHGRHRAAENEATSDLSYKAAVKALADANLTAKDIDLILLATSTPDQPVPSTACYLQAMLGCEGVPASDVAAGCSGFGYAMQMAAACVKSGLHQRVLVVGADCLTRITNYKDRQSCILFGDGAGAVVVAKGGFLELIHTEIGSDGSAAKLIQIRAGGSREPASEASVAGARHTLELQGREVFKVAVRQMVDCIRRAAEVVGIGVEDFDLIIPHQANARIIESVGKHLGVSSDRVVIDIADTGNMASASIPVALGRARESGRLKPGQTIVVVGFGAGTTWACQAFRVLKR
jgi:3-oxoacyl-[acyl-carrier-protein] synthase III